MQTYTITRLFRDSPNRTIVKRGLTLEEAQAHCSDPETSSSTCTSAQGPAAPGLILTLRNSA